MKAPCVRLPDEQLLEPIAIAQAIADAYYPLYEFSSGMDCVLNVRDKRAGNLPFEITQLQRDVLAELLPKLPKLHGRMPDSEVQVFILAFEKLALHLPWTPSIVDDHARYKQRERIEQYIQKHLADLKRSVAESYLIAVDGNHIRCNILSVGAFIPRNEAIKYLESNGHTVEFNTLTNKIDSNFVTASSSTERISVDAGSAFKHRAKDQPSPKSEPNVSTSQKPLTDDQSENTYESKSENKLNQNSKCKKPVPTTVSDDAHPARESHHPIENEPTSAETEADQFIAIDEIMTLIGAKRTTVYDMMKKGSKVYDPTFPLMLPKRPGSSASRWSLREIQAWQAQQKKK